MVGVDDDDGLNCRVLYDVAFSISALLPTLAEGARSRGAVSQHCAQMKVNTESTWVLFAFVINLHLLRKSHQLISWSHLKAAKMAS